MTGLSPMASETGASRLAEFSAGWTVLLGAAIGTGVSVVVLPSAAIGLFMRDLQSEFGWSRTEISLGSTILVLTLAAIAPFLGGIADRVRPRLVIGVSLAALAAGLYLFSGLNGDLFLYYLGLGALGVFASGSTTIVYAKVLSAVFHKIRGLALGLAMIGSGVTVVLLPLLLAPYAATHGWRAGFVALALLVIMALPLVVLLIGSDRARPATDTPPAQAGGLGDALSSRTFWIMLLCFTLIPFAVSGLSLHFFAYLSDLGVTPARAGAIASVVGTAMIVARVLTGFLIDHIFAPHVAGFTMAGSALAIAAMGLWGANAAVLGAIAMGFSVGAELDLIGYMTARYFGLERFGRIYGIMYGSVLAGGAASPIAYGMIADLTGAYQVGIYGAAVLLIATALLFFVLPRFEREEAH